MVYKVKQGDRILYCGNNKGKTQILREYPDCDIYYLVNKLADPSRKTEKGATDCSDANYGSSEWIFVEFDRELPDFECPPSRIVQSSPGKYHVYWRVPELANLELPQVKQYFKALSTHYGTDLTKPLQMLRLPGSYNQKYPDKPEVLLLEDNASTYTLDQLFKGIPVEQPPQVRRRQSDPFNEALVGLYLKDKLDRFFAFPDRNHNEHLNRTAFIIVTDWANLADRASIIDLLTEWASDNSHLPSSEIDSTLKKFHDETRYPARLFFEAGLEPDLEYKKSVAHCYHYLVESLVKRENGKADPLMGASLRNWFLSRITSNLGYSPRSNYFLDRNGVEINPFKVATSLEGWLINSAIKEERRIYGQLESNQIEPIVEYFKGLPKVSRSVAEDTLKELCLGVMGLSNLDYLQVRKWLILAAKRARYGLEQEVINPYCLLFYGEQGVGKSAFFEILGGKWHYSYSEGGDNLLSRCRSLTVSLDEYDRFSSKHQAELKVLISDPKDTVRPKYGRSVLSLNRLYSWGGTTNSTSITKDPTGNRRFLIVTLPQKYRQPYDIEYLKRNRDLIWASALALSDTEPVEFEAEKIQEIESSKEQFAATTHQEEILNEWVNDALEGVEPYQPGAAYSYSEVARVISPNGRLTPGEKAHLIDVLYRLGWRKGVGYRGGKKHNWMVSPSLTSELKQLTSSKSAALL